MAERPEPTGEPVDPDESSASQDLPEPAASDGPMDPWSDAVDRPRMGFSGGESGGGSDAGPPRPLDDDSDDSNDSDDSDDGDLGELGAMLQQLLGGMSVGQGGPDLGALIRQLGGAGGLGGGAGMPDLGQLMRQFGMEPGDNPGEAIAQMWKQMGIDPTNSSMMSMLQNQMQQFFSAQSPADRMGMSADVARKTVAVQADPTVTAAQQREVDEAVRVAQMWVDPVTTLDAPTGSGLAWSRAEWVEATMPTWHRLVEPVSDGVTAAMTGAMDEQFRRLREEGLGDAMPDLPDLPGIDVGGLLEHLQPALRQLAGSVFSAQLGHGVGALASDLLSATEVGLPLLASEDVALLPANISAFTEGLGVDASEVRLYLAVREGARVRLFSQVPWLGPQLESAVRDYARNIRIDTDAIEEQVRSMDLQNPGAIQEALQHKLFSPTPTAAQKAALGRLETALALVEGWVDLVTDQATEGHLPNAAALGEALRRRRIGGPAQKTFSGLVGLELSTRRLKDARNLWAALESSGGIELRDAPWEHPDIAPTGDDLDDPLGYVEKRRSAGTTDDLDSALESLLSDSRTDDSPSDAPADAPTDPSETGDPADTADTTDTTDTTDPGPEDNLGPRA